MMQTTHTHMLQKERIVRELRGRAKTFECPLCRYTIEKHADLLEVALKAVHEEGDHGRDQGKEERPA